MLAFFFSPSGRFGRAKWWLAQLAGLPVVGTVFFLITMLRSATGPQPSSLDVVMSLSFIVLFVLLFWMMFCVTVKRYHDRNKSGWWYLIQFIPLIGGLWALVELGFCSGDDGDNDYGPGPGLNIDEDLKAMMAGMPNTAQSAPQRATMAPAYQAARVSNSGAPVFGKRG